MVLMRIRLWIFLGKGCIFVYFMVECVCCIFVIYFVVKLFEIVEGIYFGILFELKIRWEYLFSR